jgi:2-methylfumaryl-CoA isomerase
MLGYPVSTFEDMAHDEQLAARDFWYTLDAPWAEPVCAPGGFALFDGRRPRPSRGAPGLGEHTADVLCGELGVSTAELEGLRAAGIV